MLLQPARRLNFNFIKTLIAYTDEFPQIYVCVCVSTCVHILKCEMAACVLD